VQDAEEKLEAAEVAHEEVTDRTQIMEEHLKSVQSELQYTQARVTAKRKEIKTEAHLKALSERELARYNADAKVLTKERAELADKIASVQNQIYRANEKMDQFKVCSVLLEHTGRSRGGARRAGGTRVDSDELEPGGAGAVDDHAAAEGGGQRGD
jgi:chromosome segregation ATPase